MAGADVDTEANLALVGAATAVKRRLSTMAVWRSKDIGRPEDQN